MAKTENKHYLSGKEIRAIAKANAKEMNRLEKKKYRKADESEFVTEMKDPANILQNYFNVWGPPGICIIIAVLGFNFVGDGLRDALDPKMRR